MKGHPKDKVGDNVSFTINNETRNGIIMIHRYPIAYTEKGAVLRI